MKKLFVVFALALLVLGSTNAAFAWSWNLNQGSGEVYDGQYVGPFDRLGIWSVSGDLFANPGFSNLSAPGWISGNNSANTYSYAFGPTVDGTLFMTENFQDNLGGPVATWLAMAANGNDVRQRQLITYNNGNYSFTDVSSGTWQGYNVGNSVTVPEPVSTVLFLIGGATMAVRKLRRK